jgi:hypothetical protein
MRILTAVLLLPALLGGTVQGQPCQVPGSDTIAIVFDVDYEHMPVCREFRYPAEIVPAYLVLINPTQESGIIGWELGLDIDLGPQILIDLQIIGAPIILPPELPDLQVGFGSCLEWAPVIHLATLTFLVLTPDPVTFHIRPIANPTVPNQVVYVPCDSPGSFIPMQTINAGWDEPVAVLNGSDCEYAPVLCADPAIANEELSWGAVKSLYR